MGISSGQFGISVRASSCPIETSNLTFTETHPRMGISPVSSVYPSEHSPTLCPVVTNYNAIVAEQTIDTSNHNSSEIILAIYIIKICHFVCIIFFFYMHEKTVCVHINHCQPHMYIYNVNA